MDEKGREVFLKLLKMLVARDFNNKVVNEEWNEYLEWFLNVKESGRCPVLTDGSLYWTSNDLKAKDRLWLTLRECLLSHRWSEALDTLIVLADTPVYASTYTIPRVGMELIYQMGMNHEMFNNLITSSRLTNNGLSKKEMTIDAFLFSLVTNFTGGLDISNTSLNMFAKLTKTLEERIRRTQNYKYFNSSSEQLNNLLFDEIYKGLAAYAKWLLTKIELEGMQEEASEEKEKLLEILAVQFKEAIEHISRGVEEDGNWSSYIGKVVEMVEYQANIEDNKEVVLRAEVVLQIYLKKHSRDLACKKMLYALYLRHRDIFPVDKAISVLRDIVSLCPSDPLTLSLVKGEEKVSRKIKLLVNFLHYNKEHHKAWMLLVSTLQNSLSIESEKQTITKTLQTLVSQRELHRCMFFFNPGWTDVNDLMVVKASVACLLMGRKCAMYKGVRQLIRKIPNKPSLYNLFKSVRHSSYNIEL